MGFKILGVVSIVIGCASFGFYSVYKERKEITQLRALLRLLDAFKMELMHSSSPIAKILRIVANDPDNQIHNLFRQLADVLDQHVSPNVSHCMDMIITQHYDLTDTVRSALNMVGDSLGSYGLELQLAGLASVRASVSQTIKSLRDGQQERHRCMQTLWLCAGAGIAILLV